MLAGVSFANDDQSHHRRRKLPSGKTCLKQLRRNALAAIPKSKKCENKFMPLM